MAAVASRYARAFADVVFHARLNPSETAAQLRSLVDLISSNRELQAVFDTPAISTDQKVKLLSSIAEKEGSSAPVRNFVAILIERGRIAQLSEVAAQFEHELNNRLGIAEADVVSALPMEADAKSEMEQQIGRLVGKSQVKATYSTDANLIGGVIVRIGSTIYDGSVRGQLQKIREQLVNS